MAISFDELTGQAPEQWTQTPARPGVISFDELTGVAPPQSAWEKTKSFFAQGDQVLGAPKAMQGVTQLGQEVKALSNMLVGIPGGAAGVAMDIGSRISSLAIGEDAKSAGVRARKTAEHTNELWGKVTGALGLTQDASGSNIQNWMEQGIAATDVGGAKLEQATGGVLTKETAQSVRDTLLNALGVKGMGMKGVAKGKPTRTTGEALAADQAIRDSKARVKEAAAAKEAQAAADVAAGTAKAEAVDALVKSALEKRHPLDAAFEKGKPKVAPESPAWDAMVKGLVEPEGVPSLAERVAEKPYDPRFPPEEGVAKTRLDEPVVIGEAPDLVATGIDNLRQGKLISAAQANAIRKLKPLSDQGLIVGPNGKPYFQRGAVDPSLLKVLGLMGLGAVAGTALYNWFQSPGGLSGDNARELKPPSLTGEQATTLAAGLMGATVMRKAPGKYEAMLSSKNTAGLVEAFKAGGKEMEGAARAIHDATRGQLERSLYTFKDKIDVEQAVQDAYTNTFQALSEGKFEGGSEISTYLYRAAKNAAIDMQRKKNVRPQEITSAGDRQGGTDFGAEGGEGNFALAEGSTDLTPERMVSNQQMVAKMEDALAKLPEQQREIFKARELDGLDYEEIAVQFDIPVGTVRSNLSRARENLQKSLSVYKPDRQSGVIDQKLLEGVGMVAGGAVVGGLMADDASKGRVVGALSGLAALAGTSGPARAALMRGTTRLMEVDPELRRAVRESEMQASQEVSAASDAISGFVKPVKKLSAEAQAKLDAAYSQADPSGVRAALSESPEALKGYQKLREFLGKTGDRLKAFGRFKEGVPDYLPLLVKDYKGLMDTLGLTTREGLEKYLHNANTKSIKETGNALNEVEKSLLVNDYLLRDPATSYLPGFAKHRRLRMTEETRPFYHTMDDALIRYAHAAVEDIAEAQFFGKDLRTSKVGGQLYTNLDNSIGALTARAIEEGRMTPEQAVEVQAVLRARYGKGKMAPSGWAQDARNVSGAALLGQIGSGLVQTSEALFSTYHHGIRPAIEAVGIQLTGRGIKPGEFGLANHVIEEVIGSRASGKVLSALLKANLLATFDQMGMGQNLTASFVKNKRLAANPRGQAKLIEKWGADYGPDMPQLIQELQASTSKSRTPLVDSLLYQELSDVRPTSRAEAPELYNLHPNARLMYHLKQFMLTQADIMYRDAAQNIKSGDPKRVAKGLKNLALYSAALSTAVIPSDAIKNWLMGRGLKLDKIDYVDNFVRNFGLSRYTMNQVMRSDQPGKAMVDAGVKMLTPPVASVAQTLGKGLSDPKEAVPLIPLVGRAIYNRELGGNEKALRNEQLQKRLDLRDAREARNPSLKAARLRKREAAKRAADAKLRRTQ